MKYFKYPSERKADNIEKTLRKPNGRGAASREKGRANLEAVQNWVNGNPGGSTTECIRGTGLSYYVVARCFKVIFK